MSSATELSEFPRARGIKHQMFHAQRLLVPPRSSLPVLYSKAEHLEQSAPARAGGAGTRDGARCSRVGRVMVDEERCQRSRQGEDGISPALVGAAAKAAFPRTPSGSSQQDPASGAGSLTAGIAELSPAGLEGSLLFHRAFLPSSGFKGIVRDDKHWESPFLLLYLPAGRRAAPLWFWQHPPLQGQSRASCCGRETQGHGWDMGDIPHRRSWGAETHVVLPVVREWGVGLLLPTLASLSKGTCEPLLGAAAVLRDTELLWREPAEPGALHFLLWPRVLGRFHIHLNAHLRDTASWESTLCPVKAQLHQPLTAETEPTPWRCCQACNWKDSLQAKSKSLFFH